MSSFDDVIMVFARYYVIMEIRWKRKYIHHDKKWNALFACISTFSIEINSLLDLASCHQTTNHKSFRMVMTSSNGKHSALLALQCAGNSPVTGEFPSQRPLVRSFGVFYDLRLNKQLSKQSRRRWFETPSRPLWRHCNDISYSNQVHVKLIVKQLLLTGLSKFSTNWVLSRGQGKRSNRKGAMVRLIVTNVFMPPPLGARGIMFSDCPSVRPSVRPKPEITSFHLCMGPLVHPTNRDRFAACPSVRPERFPGICRSEYCQSVTNSSRIVEMFNATFSYFSTNHILKMASGRLCIPHFIPLTTQFAIKRYKRLGDVCFCMFKPVIVISKWYQCNINMFCSHNHWYSPFT